MDFILSKIKSSRFIVAEISSGNLGVYYEAGYAMGKGLPVIAVAKEKEKIHFDLQQFNTIFYKDLDDLEEKLSNRITNLFGKIKK